MGGDSKQMKYIVCQMMVRAVKNKAGKGWDMGGRMIVILKRLSDRLTEKVTFEQRPEGGDRWSQAGSWRNCWGSGRSRQTKLQA